MRFLIEAGINFLALYLAEFIFPIIKFDSLRTMIATAFILTILNYILKPILHFICFPITILTLGIFSLFINAYILKLALKFTHIEITSFFSLILISIFI